jgi:Zn-dependent protease
MLGTSTTPYDLRFRLLGIPVRVHPLFWLVSAILGWQDQHFERVVLWIGCVFISILVHEFGHGLTSKHFRDSPWILLYSMGGLCYSERQGTRGQRLAVILAGPGAGFLLFLVTLVVWTLLLGISPREHLALILFLIVDVKPDPVALLSGFSKFGQGETGMMFWAYYFLIRINLLWTFVNLLPIWPLDGGQASQIVASVVDPRNGVRRNHILSLVTAGILAVIAGVRTSDLFLTFFFGMFAYLNFQVLQSMHDTRSLGVGDDDWWRR